MAAGEKLFEASKMSGTVEDEQGTGRGQREWRSVSFE
jgi:hypothetical protein